MQCGYSFPSGMWMTLGQCTALYMQTSGNISFRHIVYTLFICVHSPYCSNFHLLLPTIGSLDASVAILSVAISAEGSNLRFASSLANQ